MPLPEKATDTARRGAVRAGAGLQRDVPASEDAITSGDVIAPAAPDAMRLVQEVAAIAER